MASYHTSFSYRDKNSFDEGYIITAFEPDSGFKDTFLSMENISDAYYDGTKRFDYGAKYSSQSEVNITLIKKDGTDVSTRDLRECAKWLTGARVNSWLDMYVGDTIIYSFLGKVLNLEQYKLDGRTIGVRLTFLSLSPWAYSQPQTFSCDIGQALFLDNHEILTKISTDVSVINDEEDESVVLFGISQDGTLYMNYLDEGSYFDVEEQDDGFILWVDTTYKTTIDNLSDDLYTYINLDIDFTAINNCNQVMIYNETLDEKTIIDDIKAGEKILVSANQFITSNSAHHSVFGDDFNFVWPRLKPGENNLSISGGGTGSANFTYRYPMKIGDCVMDIDVSGNSVICDHCPDNGGNSGNIVNGTISWENIINTPTTIGGYGITDAYTMVDIDYKIENMHNCKIDKEEFDAMIDNIFG